MLAALDTSQMLTDLIRLCVSYSMEINETTIRQVRNANSGLSTVEQQWLTTLEALIAINFDLSFCFTLAVPQQWYLSRANEGEYVMGDPLSPMMDIRITSEIYQAVPRTPFHFFKQHQSQALREANPDVSHDVLEVSHAIAEQWDALDDTVRQPFIDMSIDKNLIDMAAGNTKLSVTRLNEMPPCPSLSGIQFFIPGTTVVAYGGPRVVAHEVNDWSRVFDKDSFPIQTRVFFALCRHLFANGEHLPSTKRRNFHSFKTKKGRHRATLNGKRADYTHRAVVGPEPIVDPHTPDSTAVVAMKDDLS